MFYMPKIQGSISNKDKFISYIVSYRGSFNKKVISQEDIRKGLSDIYGNEGFSNGDCFFNSADTSVYIYQDGSFLELGPYTPHADSVEEVIKNENEFLDKRKSIMKTILGLTEKGTDRTTEENEELEKAFKELDSLDSWIF